MEGAVILKATVTHMEALKDANIGMTYGVLEKESDINCKVAMKVIKQLKI